MAEVDVELIYDETGWSPYLLPDEVHKLEAVRQALSAGDTTTAAKLSRVFEVTPVAIDAAR